MDHPNGYLDISDDWNQKAQHSTWITLTGTSTSPMIELESTTLDMDHPNGYLDISDD
ncbi:hypothetical protein XANCAGTX0491_008621 [Xanthoria calcicola]